MKSSLLLWLFSVGHVFAAFLASENESVEFISECVNPSFSFLYKGLNGLKFKKIIDTYESQPTFVLTFEEISAYDFNNSTATNRINIVLDLESSYIRKELLLGPFRTAPINPRGVSALKQKIRDKTGTALEFVMVPRGTPFRIVEGLKAENISVIDQLRQIDFTFDFNTSRLKDLIMVDLSRNGLDFIMNMGKYLDDADKSLFSLKECLNITPPGREQTRSTKSTSEKVNSVKDAIRRLSISGSPGWEVSRANVLDDSLHRWANIDDGIGSEFIKNFTIIFIGEPGSDFGGLTKEWFSLITKAAFGTDSRYFNTVQGDLLYSVPKSDEFGELYYQFFGNFIAKVILNGHNAQVNFPDFLLKMMLGRKPNFHDLKQADPQIFNTFNLMTGTIESGSDVFGTFSYTKAIENGPPEDAELKPNGSEIYVSEDNKYEFMGLRFKAYVDTPQIKTFVKAFRDVIVSKITSNTFDIFKPEELRLLIAGSNVIEVDDWQRNTNYDQIYRASSRQVVWFWEIVRDVDEATRRQILRWVTGSASVPIGGFSALSPKFKINYMPLNQNRDQLNFPRAHTCFNSIDLPEYDSKEVMRTRLLSIIEQEGFGFA